MIFPKTVLLAVGIAEAQGSRLSRLLILISKLASRSCAFLYPRQQCPIPTSSPALSMITFLKSLTSWWERGSDFICPSVTHALSVEHTQSAHPCGHDSIWDLSHMVSALKWAGHPAGTVFLWEAVGVDRKGLESARVLYLLIRYNFNFPMRHIWRTTQ